MKTAIYCRLSEEDRDKRSFADDSASIQNQKSMLVQYAIEQGWEIYGIYSDDDYAGADRNRPAFRRLLEDAEKRLFDIILCKTQSRFTRELELVEKYLHGSERSAESAGKWISYWCYGAVWISERPRTKGAPHH